MRANDLLGPGYEAILKRALAEFPARLTPDPNNDTRTFDLFYPSFGVSDDRVPVMLVGQATNGWEPSFTLSLLDPRGLVADASYWSNTGDTGEENPLAWVNKRWGKGLFRSFFWQVGYKVTNRYVGNPLHSDAWCRSMVWTNLAKIAPRGRGNPDAHELAAQLPSAIELFRYEMEKLRPEVVLLLTNWEPWAKPFLSGFARPTPFTPDPARRIEWMGHRGPSTIIVTKRPHPSSGDYASGPYVDEIMAALGQDPPR